MITLNLSNKTIYLSNNTVNTISKDDYTSLEKSLLLADNLNIMFDGRSILSFNTSDGLLVLDDTILTYSILDKKGDLGGQVFSSNNSSVNMAKLTNTDNEDFYSILTMISSNVTDVADKVHILIVNDYETYADEVEKLKDRFEKDLYFVAVK